MTRKLPITICLLLLISFLFGQQNGDVLIDRLKQNLFSIDNTTVLLYKHIGEVDQHYEVDSTFYIRSKQPNPDSVLLLLEQIMFTKEPNYIPDLQRIYDRHIDLFWEEWSQVFLKNYYSPKAVQDQYTILVGFETTLKSLAFAKEGKTHNEIFQYFKSQIIFYDSLSDNISDRCEIMKSYFDYSPKFRKLNPCALYFGSIRFNYIDPFLKELEPYFLDCMKSCSWEDCDDSRKSVNCRIFYSYQEIYYDYSNSLIVEYFIDNYAGLRNCYRTSLPFKFAQYCDNEKLARFLAKKIVTELTEEEFNMFPFVNVFTYNQNNLSILVDELDRSYNSKKEKVYKILRMIPADELLSFMKNKTFENIIIDDILKN